MTGKWCNKCGEFKSLSDFSVSRRNKDGRHTICKTCDSERSRAYGAAHSEKRKKYNHSYGAAHSEEKKDYNRIYHTSHTEERRERDNAYKATHLKEWQEKNHKYHAARWKIEREQKLKKQYGLSSDDYNALLAIQQGKCAICGGDNDGRRLYVDHDHTTGKVRGLLCRKCNAGLGMFGDTTELLCKAVCYLENHYIQSDDYSI